MSQEENNNEQDLPQHSKEQIEEIKTEEQLRKKWRKEIDKNAAMQAYFKQFTPEQVTSFINDFLFYKHLWVKHGQRCLDSLEEHSIQWVTVATEHLKIIQQKKLFDVQCLWRADKIIIPEIQVSWDFKIWGKNILNCHFIEPISAEEVELYQQFLLQSSVNEDLKWYQYVQWQDYENLIAAYNDSDDADGDFPEWYDFINIRTGNGSYLTLPDIRGKKEEFYLDIGREIKWADETVAIEANANWEDGIKTAAIKYYTKKVAEALPEAYEQYLLNLEMNIGFSVDEKWNFDMNRRLDMLTELLFLGRKERGEPEDFNF
ncbi:unnamed protein product [Rotaria sp. Silwood1]|nr:unnamed protein product [Rotaria sp. Silwood1]CAF4659557.1 unnamed protein product [Rotaria sp. Silwood1]